MNSAKTVSPDDDLIKEIVRRIVNVASPLSIILFGSHARGNACPDSDLDFLVVANSKEPRFKRSIPIYAALSNIPIAMDIMVYTQEEVEDWRNVRQAFITTVIREGKVLYEKQSQSG